MRMPKGKLDSEIENSNEGIQNEEKGLVGIKQDHIDFKWRQLIELKISKIT